MNALGINTSADQPRESDGRFGFKSHTRAGISLSESALDEARISPQWERVLDDLDECGIARVTREDLGEDSVIDLGDEPGTTLVLTRDGGRTSVEVRHEFSDAQTEDPEFRAYMAAVGARRLPGSSVYACWGGTTSGEVGEEDVAAAVEDADFEHALRLRRDPGDGYARIGQFREYLEWSQTRRTQGVESAAQDFQEDSLESVREELFMQGEREPDGLEVDSTQLMHVKSLEREFLQRNWDEVERASKESGYSVERVCRDVAAYRLYGADVSSGYTGEGGRELMNRASKDGYYLGSPVLADDGRTVFWE